MTPDCLVESAASGPMGWIMVAALVLSIAAVIAVAVLALRGRGAPQRRQGRAVALLLLSAIAAGAMTIGGSQLPASAAAPDAPACQGSAIGPDQEVAFLSGGVTYHASLRGPVDPSTPVPAVVIVVGTGDVDRDGNAPSLATEAYSWLADIMSANGVASLRYDKLGTGATGLGP